jgi:ubiquinone/menaquinone biosynthesis C-methylase UbiE
MLGRVGIRPGMRVLDLGCGPGFWTLPLAKMVGSQGKVWALDVSQELLDLLAERTPPAQVHLLRGELPTINLPDDSVDLVWGAFVIHEVEPLDILIREIRRVLIGQGKVAILDWRPDAKTENSPPKQHRLASGKLIDLLGMAGFEEVRLNWRNKDAYLIEAQSSSDGRK